MNETTCVTPDCIATPAITAPVALCILHALQVVASAFPQVLEAAAGGLSDGVVALRKQPIDKDRLLVVSTHDPVVYFIGNGENVKIGTTRNLRGRLTSLSLRPANVLLTLHGGTDVERELHMAFADFRIDNTEWFRCTAELQQFIVSRGGDLAEAIRSSSFSAVRSKAPDPRRELVFSIVEEAGSEGIGPEGIIRVLAGRFPQMDPPHPATIGRWLGADSRVTQPTYGRYAMASL